MGNKQNQREKVKKEYLKVIESKKKHYYRKNSDIIHSGDHRHWKDFIIQEIELVQEKYPSATWPIHLIASCKTWTTAKDYKWRSNVLWFDYLQSHKKSTTDLQPTMTSILHAPLLPTSSFESESLLSFLHSHFMNPKEHFISYLISKFIVYFLKENSEPNSHFEPSNRHGSHLSRMIDEIKAFLMLVLQSMIHYYGGVVSKMIEEKPGEMYDFILEEVFTDALQDCLLKGFSEVHKNDEINYMEKVQKYSELKCADLGIEPKFQIDVEKQGHSIGYAKAISKLREIEVNYSPLKKLESIITTTRLICECVDDYWRDDSRMNRENLIIDADQILSIFLYIVIKARVNNLKAHVNLIYEFGRKVVQNGQMGYYVTTIEACIIQVENMGSELLMKLKGYSERNSET